MTSSFPGTSYQTSTHFNRLFKVKNVGSLEEYVGVTVERRGDKMMISQPDIITRLEQYFGQEVQDLKEYKTPLPSYYHRVRPDKDVTEVLLKTDMLK